MIYWSYDPFYFNPDDKLKPSDRNCWSMDIDVAHPFGEFTLVTGDAESWESLNFMVNDPESDSAWSTGPGKPYWNPTRSKSFPWLNWVVYRSGGMDV